MRLASFQSPSRTCRYHALIGLVHTTSSAGGFDCLTLAPRFPRRIAYPAYSAYPAYFTAMGARADLATAIGRAPGYRIFQIVNLASRQYSMTLTVLQTALNRDALVS